MPDVESCVSSGNAVANWGLNSDQEHERICWKIPAIIANLKGNTQVMLRSQKWGFNGER